MCWIRLDKINIIENFERLINSAKGRKGTKATVIVTCCLICIITTLKGSFYDTYLFHVLSYVGAFIFLWVLIGLLKMACKIDRWEEELPDV